MATKRSNGEGSVYRDSERGGWVGQIYIDATRYDEDSTLMAALEANDHHVSNTARELSLERSHLYKKMRALGIDHRADEEAS